MAVLSLSLSQLTGRAAMLPVLCLRTAPAELIALARHIARDGLLNPLHVTCNEGVYTVIDGKKRLAALHLLARLGKLPRSLSRVPVSFDAPLEAQRPMLKSEAELVQIFLAAHKAGQSPLEIARRYACSLEFICRALSLTTLHPQIMDYFRAGHLTLDQAAAFASLPHHDAQWALLLELGPFAHAKDVIAAILRGETVIETADGNVHILPSRVKSDPEQARDKVMALERFARCMSCEDSPAAQRAA